MSLFDIVHDIKFTDIFKVFVHSFDQVVDKLQVSHFVLFYLKKLLILKDQDRQ